VYIWEIFGLKVLAVIILGGLDSIGGAILGGFIIGILENLTGLYIDPLIGGGRQGDGPLYYFSDYSHGEALWAVW